MSQKGRLVVAGFVIHTALRPARHGARQLVELMTNITATGDLASSLVLPEMKVLVAYGTAFLPTRGAIQVGDEVGVMATISELEPITTANVARQQHLEEVNQRHMVAKLERDWLKKKPNWPDQFKPLRPRLVRILTDYEKGRHDFYTMQARQLALMISVSGWLLRDFSRLQMRQQKLARNLVVPAKEPEYLLTPVRQVALLTGKKIGAKRPPVESSRVHEAAYLAEQFAQMQAGEAADLKAGLALDPAHLPEGAAIAVGRLRAIWHMR